MTDAIQRCSLLTERYLGARIAELLIRCAGWQPETFASAQGIPRPSTIRAPSCLVLDVSLRALNRPRFAERVAAEPDGHADHLHHRLRRRPNDGPGYESGRGEF